MVWFDNTVWEYWRIINLVVNLLCIVWSIGGLKRQRHLWNAKSLEMWYSRLMWAVTGSVLSYEGLANDRGWSYTLAFVSVATFSSFHALYRKGTWGYEPEVAMIISKKEQNLNSIRKDPS